MLINFIKCLLILAESLFYANPSAECFTSQHPQKHIRLALPIIEEKA